MLFQSQKQRKLPPRKVLNEHEQISNPSWLRSPGLANIAEGLTEEDMRAGFTMGADINLLSFVRMMQERGHKSAGSIRASIGLVTNFADVWHFLRFIADFRDQTRLTIGEVTFDIDSCRIIRDGS